MKKYADWYIIREAEKKGLVASMTNIIEGNRTELNNELSAYFRSQISNYKSMFDEDEGEDVLYAINEYIEKNSIDKHELDFPYSEGTDIHMLKITENLHLKIVIADEYYGGGSYEKYVGISNFVINENTTEKDVDVLVGFVRDYLT